MNQGLTEWLTNLNTSFQIGSDLVQDFAKSSRDYLSDLFFDPAEADFDDFLKSLRRSFADALADIAMDLMKSTLFSGGSWLKSLLGIATGSASTGGAPMGAESFGAEAINSMVWLHRGGVPAYDNIPSYGVPASLFANAPRYHNGIGPGEQAAIIRKDEGVFTPGQMRALGSSIGSVNISVPVTVNAEGISSRLSSRIRNVIEKAVREEMKAAS